MTRNARRQAAKTRLLAKSERIAKAELARIADANHAIVLANLNAPAERNYYPASNLGSMAQSSHRAYICRAGGQMGRGRAMALKAKGSY